MHFVALSQVQLLHSYPVQAQCLFSLSTCLVGMPRFSEKLQEQEVTPFYRDSIKISIWGNFWGEWAQTRGIALYPQELPKLWYRKSIAAQAAVSFLSRCRGYFSPCAPAEARWWSFNIFRGKFCRKFSRMFLQTHDPPKPNIRQLGVFSFFPPPQKKNHSLLENLNGGSQTGAEATNFQRKSDGNRPWKNGPFRGWLGPIRAFSGNLGPIGTNSSAPHPRVCRWWFPNGGSSFPGERNSPTSFLPQFNLLFTSVLPQFYLFNLCFVTNLEPRFGNHGLQTLGSQQQKLRRKP